MREEHLIDPVTKFVPDVPDVGDKVRAYANKNSEYYIEGIVVSYDDDNELYQIRYTDRSENPDRILETSAYLVELVQIKEKL